MPRPSRRSKRRNAGSEGQSLDNYLLTGFDLTFALAEGPDEEVLREYWEQNRERLLLPWIREKPGTRPWGWWRYDAPERRRTINGRVHPFDDPRRTLNIAQSDRKDFWQTAYALHFGIPRMFLMPFDEDLQRDFMANVLHGRESQIFEPEWSYLERLNLLVVEDSP